MKKQKHKWIEYENGKKTLDKHGNARFTLHWLRDFGLDQQHKPVRFEEKLWWPKAQEYHANPQQFIAQGYREGTPPWANLPREEGMLTGEQLYEEIQKAGIEIDSHFSDLYVPVTPVTQGLIEKYICKQNVKRFKSNIDGTPWFDVPFAYQPFWEKAHDEAVRRQKLDDEIVARNRAARGAEGEIK